MADKKISQLTTLAQADVAVTADFLPIVDTSATETKKATPQALVQAGATGATLPVALGAVGTPSYTFTGDLNTGLWSPAADTLAASTGGSERLRVDSSGNVGIGTIALTARGNLDISSGNTGTAITKSIHLGYSAADFYGYRIANTNTAASFAAGTFSIQRGTTAAWVDDLVINDSGNLGIGTASPAYRLDVSSAGTSLARYTGAEYSQVQHSDGTRVLFTQVYDNVAVLGTATNTPLMFAPNNVERMRIDSSGNLGIGTASPASRLDVTGAFGTSTTAFTINNSTATSASNIARIDFRVNNSFSGNERVAAVWGINPNAAANNGGALVFGVSANGTSTTPSEVARFDQAGNLGIGTASPEQKLHVAGGGNTYLATQRTAASTSALVMGSESGKNSIYSWTTPTGATGVPLGFTIGGTEVMNLDASANATIGGGTLATTATNGFLYVPTCAGTPTGTPTAKTGYAPIVVNTTNNKLYFYSGGAWRDAGP